MLKSRVLLLLGFSLSACSTMPNGPSVLVLPGEGRPYAQFHEEDLKCREAARTQVLASPDRASTKDEAQHRYNNDYLQCMFGFGHRIPLPTESLQESFDECYPPLQHGADSSHPATSPPTGLK